MYTSGVTIGYHSSIHGKPSPVSHDRLSLYTLTDSPSTPFKSRSSTKVSFWCTSYPVLFEKEN